MTSALRVFVDFNVLLSATRTEDSNLRLLWALEGVEILISRYVIEEVRRHLVRSDQRARLWKVLYKSHLAPDGEEVVLPELINLPDKDIPVLQAAVAGKANLLITGDFRHFGPLFDSTIAGVRIESTSVFKARYPAIFPSRGIAG